MFTGIIMEMGGVAELRQRGSTAVFSVEAGAVAEGAAPGDSIAVNGVCLTVTQISGSRLAFDVSDETLRSTALGRLRPGQRVNLEPALRPDGKLGGHFVTGHVDAVGKVLSRRDEGKVIKFEISAPPEVMRLLLPKGSVAVDGISLTVVEVFEGSFSLVIIPHTARLTTLGFKGPGDEVNLESDMIGKYIMKLLGIKGAEGDSPLVRALREKGFMG